MDTLWGYWLNEPIYVDKGVFNIVKRKEAIRHFCVNGLVPLIESAGYRLYLNDTEVVNVILKVLFTIYTGKKVLCNPVDIPHEEEHFTTYQDKLDTLEWQSFWQRWGDIQDFEKDSYGYVLQYSLPHFIWSWISFDSSKTIQQLERELEELDNEDFVKGRDDPYLQETAKRDYHDRHW